MDPQLRQVLEAREARWQFRQELTAQTGRPVISVTLCVPERFRTDQKFYTVFQGLCGKFAQLLESRGIPFTDEGELNGADGPVRFYSSPADAALLKELCVLGEETLPGGRMLDIDLMTADGTPVSRAAAGLPPRRCVVCQNEAALCVSRRLHSREEVERQVILLYEEAARCLEQTKRGSL